MDMDFGNTSPSMRRVYGMSETDYPDANNLGVSIFLKAQHQPFPQELEDQFKHMQSNFSTGLFPSVSRAWMAIDSDLFIWNFEKNTDLAYMDSISNTILLVDLCKHRATFKKPDMQYFLVVATTVEILLIALTFQDASGVTRPISETCFKSSFAFIVGDPLYKLPLEGLIVSNIRCTETGRIFFSADDCFYELEYYDKTWLSGYSCKKINHTRGLLSSLVPVLNIFSHKDEIRQLEIDDSRNLLYVLFKSGDVVVFDMESDGKTMRKCLTYTREKLARDSTTLCNVTADYFKEVVTVHAVPVTTSYNVYFILTTTKGVRIYLSCLEFDLNSNMKLTQAEVRPKTIRVVQIRFPNSDQSFSLRNANIYSSYAAGDTCLMASNLGSDQSDVWMFTSSNFIDSPRSDEHSSAFAISGAVWMMNKSVEQDYPPVFRDPSFLPKEQDPLIVRQHFCRAEKFFILSSKGVLTFLHLSPVEIYRKILAKYGSESKEFQSLVSLLPKHEICIMAIIVLCSDNPADVSIKDSALRTFFVHGGEPHVAVISNGNEAEFRVPVRNGGIERRPRKSSGWNTPVMPLGSPKTPFQSPSVNPQFSGPLRTSTPQDPQSHLVRDYGGTFLSPNADETVAGSHVIINSSRHDALKIYFKRILAPILDCNLCYVENEQILSSFSSELLDQIIYFLGAYKQAIEQYSLISTTYSLHPRQHINDPRDATCKEQEKVALSNLRNEINLTLELLGLWNVLLEFRQNDFHAIIKSLPNNLQKELINWRFDELFKNREQACSELITCIVRFYIGDDASTIAVSNRLRETCPSIFTVDDAQVVKATENLYRVKTTTNKKERKQLIDDAIITLQQSINKLNLVQLCDLLIQIGYFEGIVDLALAKAENDDKSQLAMIAYKRKIYREISPLDDPPEVVDAMNKRNDAYSCITDTLEILRIVAEATNQVSSVTLNSSTYLFPSAEAVKELSPADAKAEFDQMIKRVFASDDELANVAVFRWLLEHDMSAVLLENECRYLESFLLHQIEMGGDGKVLDLLWKFNEKTGKHADAAKILYDMAKKSGNTPLYQRITYLTQSAICIQADAENKANTELKTEIEDTLEIAQLQLRTKTALESGKFVRHFNERQVASAIASLNNNILSLTELYQHYAVQFHLYEIQLDILHCAGHDEKEAIETVWSAILQRELDHFSRGIESATAAEARLGSLLQKMRKHFIRSLQYVPYSFILKTLLTEGLKKSVSGDWLPNICKTAEIPYNLLLDIADYEFRIGDPFWRQNPRALQLITDMVAVVCQRFKADQWMLQPKEKIALRDACLNGLAQLILDAHNRNRRSESLELLQAEIEQIT